MLRGCVTNLDRLSRMSLLEADYEIRLGQASPAEWPRTVPSEIETEPRGNSDRGLQRSPSLQIEHPVRTDLDGSGSGVASEECSRERATRPVARTDERDSEQRRLRVAPGNAAPQEY